MLIDLHAHTWPRSHDSVLNPDDLIVRAKQAGLDGVEVQCANGFLLEQFLNDATNRRSDRYGGSIENRARLLFDVLDAVCSVWNERKVGVRLSPFSTAHDCFDSDPAAEQQECVNKAKALFRAAEEARRFASAAKRGQ